MLDNHNHKNSSCNFKEQAVSFIYGEVNAQEKAAFETHLKSCSSCAEEFSSFGAVRSSILEWRNEDFSFLEMPSIQIPYEKTRGLYNSETDFKDSRSWLKEFRKLFSASPTLTASAAFALIVICAGIIFFTAKPSNNVKIAGSNNKNTESARAPSSSGVEIIPDGKSIFQVSDKTDTNHKILPEPRNKRKDLIVKVDGKPKNPAKDVIQEVKFSKIKTANVENKKLQFAQTGRIPRLNNVEEVEDKSLRLAELLDDSDGR